MQFIYDTVIITINSSTHNCQNMWWQPLTK